MFRLTFLAGSRSKPEGAQAADPAHDLGQSEFRTESIGLARLEPQFAATYSAVVSDIDGTIDISAAAEQIYAITCERNVPFALCTARDKEWVTADCKALLRDLERIHSERGGQVGDAGWQRLLDNLLFGAENSGYVFTGRGEIIFEAQLPKEVNQAYLTRLRAELKLDKVKEIVPKDHMISFRIAREDRDKHSTPYAQTLTAEFERRGVPLFAVDHGHGVHALPIGGGKVKMLEIINNILRQRLRAAGRPDSVNRSAIARFGDKGAAGGNDYEMLNSFGGFGVDQCANDVTPVIIDGVQLRNTSATNWLLDNLSFVAITDVA